MQKELQFRANQAKTHRNSSRQAFTLIELLAVISIILAMMGLVLGASRYAKLASYKGRARADVQELKTAVERFHQDNGRYPDHTSPDELKALRELLPQQMRSGTRWAKGDVNMLDDPWGRDYRYIRQSEQSYTLSSEGPKTETSADDIRSGT